MAEQTKELWPWEGRVELGQKIVSVKVTQPPTIYLTFADGFSATLDFQHLLDDGEVFLPLRDPEFFRTVHPGAGGGSLEWVTRDGEQIDLCADSLRMEAEGIWDPVKREWKI